MKDQSNIFVITNHEYCTTEPDFQIHINEDGGLRNLQMNCSAGEDNHTDLELISELFRKFGFYKKVNCLDLGCAGGSLILDLAADSASDICIGLDGSSGVYKHNNWKQEKNLQILRHANLVEPFSVTQGQESSNRVSFDLITCWEVIEHFRRDQLDIFFANVSKHLSDDGVFLGSIAMFPDVRDDNGFHQDHPQYNTDLTQYELHKTVLETEEEWNEILQKHFSVLQYDLTIRLRNHHNSYYFMCRSK